MNTRATTVPHYLQPKIIRTSTEAIARWIKMCSDRRAIDQWMFIGMVLSIFAGYAIAYQLVNRWRFGQDPVMETFVITVIVVMLAMIFISGQRWQYLQKRLVLLVPEIPEGVKATEIYVQGSGNGYNHTHVLLPFETK